MFHNAVIQCQNFWEENWPPKLRLTFLAILTLDSIGIRYHIHHHLLRRVFPTAKIFQVNLHNAAINIKSDISWMVKQRLTTSQSLGYRYNKLPCVSALRKVILSSYMHPAFHWLFSHLSPILRPPELKPQQLKNPTERESSPFPFIFFLYWLKDKSYLDNIFAVAPQDAHAMSFKMEDNYRIPLKKRQYVQKMHEKHTQLHFTPGKYCHSQQ